MKIEARNAIIIGAALILYGVLAYAWAERDRMREFHTPQFKFGRARRDKMMAEEFGTFDFEPQPVYKDIS